jgi:hypothetical protein
MHPVQSRQRAGQFFGRASEVFVTELRHTVVVEIRKIWLATGHFLVEAWSRGLDQPDARRQFDSRARQIFNAIMTDRCGECLAPIALCQQAH